MHTAKRARIALRPSVETADEVHSLSPVPIVAQATPSNAIPEIMWTTRTPGRVDVRVATKGVECER